MQKIIFFLLALHTSFAFGQDEFSIPWSMFHACEKHCGIYPVKEYKDFGGEKWRLKTGGAVFASPALLNDVLYIGSEDKNFYAIEANTGKTKWLFKTNGPIHSTAAVYQNTVYFGSFDGYYYALNTLDGKLKWKFKTEGEKKVGGKGLFGMKPLNEYMNDPWEYFLSSPIIDKNDRELTVYFGSSDGYVYAVHAETGKQKWKFKTGGIVHTTPALYDGVLFVGSWDTHLYALDAKTGIEKWRFKTGSDSLHHAMEGIQASPAYDDGKLYFGTRDGNFYAVDAKTGTLAWKYFAENSWIISTAAVKDGTVYFGTSDTYLLLALDAKTGREKYRFKANGYVYSSPAVAGNTVYFGDYTGKLFALDLTSDGKKWNEFHTATRKQHAQQILQNDMLNFKFAAKGNDLTQYKNNVAVLNQFHRLGSIVSSPVVANGVVYFGTADGHVYAVNLKDEVKATAHHYHQ